MVGCTFHMEARLIKFYSKVKELGPKKKVVRGWKDEHGDEQFKEKDLGWFMLLEGSWEALYVGETQPDGLAVGDEVEVIIQRKSLL
jgi:hypothetical protein